MGALPPPFCEGLPRGICKEKEDMRFASSARPDKGTILLLLSLLKYPGRTSAAKDLDAGQGAGVSAIFAAR